MRRFVFAQLSLSVLLLASTLVGQEPSVPVTQVKPDKMATLLPAEVAEVEIALGRLRLVPDHFRIVRKHEQWPLVPDKPVPKAPKPDTTGRQQPSVHEITFGQRSYQVSAAEGRPALRLSYADSVEKWTVHIDSQIGAEWSRQYRVDGHQIQIDYVQKPYQPIVITIAEEGSQPVILRGTTLWHLTADGSPTFIKFVLPSLSRLNPNWDLPKALASAKRMRDQSGLAARLSEHQLAQHLADLDSSDHRVRTAAKQKMRDAGLAAQIPLEKLRQGNLSPQQRSTVDELLAGLEPRSADTPTRLAYWLSGDANWR